MADSILQTPIGHEEDIRPINQVYHPIQEEISHELTCDRHLTHQVIRQKKNEFKSFPHEEDMKLAIRRTSSEREGDQRLLTDGFRSHRDEPSYKSTFFGNLIHQRYQANLNQFKIHHGLKVIQLLNQEMPRLPYLEAHGFNHLLDQLWRPGSAHNHSEDTYKHPGGSFIILEGLDLRTNPFKGGGDGVILDRLYVINNQLSSEEEQPEELREITPGMEAIDKENVLTLELTKEGVFPWTRETRKQRWRWRQARLRKSCGLVRRMRPWRRQGQPKLKLSETRLWPKRKRQWAYGKAQGANGSKEESKARDAKPPDGLNVDNNLCMDLSPIRSLLWLDSVHVGYGGEA